MKYYYKSKYKLKGNSVYGEVNLCDLKSIVKLNEQNVPQTAMLPNALDGKYVLPLLTRGYNVTCYEENKQLLHGGEIDNFYSNGLINRTHKYKDKININQCDYYNSNDSSKYDIIYINKTIHYNTSLLLEEKIDKLLSNLNDDGYLYIKYHISINKNDGLPMLGEMKKILEKKKVLIVFYREKDDLKEDLLHPYNTKKHYHKYGHILIQNNLKGDKIRNKRVFKKVINAKSILGITNKAIGEYKKFIDENCKNNPKILFSKGFDGYNLIQYANYNTFTYESNNILLNGGKKGNNETHGLYHRIKQKNISTNVVEDSFYNQKERLKYDFIFSFRELHINDNDMTLSKKIDKLKQAVKENGYIHITYFLNEENRIKLNYFNYGEIINYFPYEDWEVLFIIESRKAKKKIYDFDDNLYKVRKEGRILVKKKNHRVKHKCSYEITLSKRLII